ncbi:Uncharacterised protein [Mannheimia haemolytica]|uniref:Lipoprotein n=1 Tax=Mannheimia haemolytica TaxID=75985 RepID=A0A378N9F4_MANHA|nr:Uncharacterised protein [Mannheimia haemolytica]
MKKFAKVLMVAVPAFALAACSSSSDDAAANAAANAAAKCSRRIRWFNS